MRKPYSSDLTDAQWELVREFIPQPVWWQNLQAPKYPRREILNAIFYRQRTGCQWRNLPNDLPPGKQVADYFASWRRRGVLDRIHDALRDAVREATPHADGSPRTAMPTRCILDSQSAKSTTTSTDERGFDAAKKVKGRKRHLVVDMLGLLLLARVTSASVQDRDAAPALMHEARTCFPTLDVAYMDGAYAGQAKVRIEHETGLEVRIVKRTDIQKGASYPSQRDGRSSEPSVG